jgi:hypothetical protein
MRPSGLNKSVGGGAGKAGTGKGRTGKRLESHWAKATSRRPRTLVSVDAYPVVGYAFTGPGLAGKSHSFSSES